MENKFKIITTVNEFGYSEEEIAKFPVSKKVRGVVFLDDDNIVCVEEGYKGISEGGFGSWN